MKIIHSIKKIILFSLLISIQLYSNTGAYSIIFVHLGRTLPSYLYDSVEQARLFNPDASIYLIANKEALKNTKSDLKNTILINCEELSQSTEHAYFIKHSTLNNYSYDGFWRKATERFFYLAELIQLYNLKNVFHMEYDNMLYVDLSTLLHTFENYQGIGAIFDNEDRCIPSFMYNANTISIK